LGRKKAHTKTQHGITLCCFYKHERRKASVVEPNSRISLRRWGKRERKRKLNYGGIEENGMKERKKQLKEE
jgi:hypothetical protein